MGGTLDLSPPRHHYHYNQHYYLPTITSNTHPDTTPTPPAYHPHTAVPPSVHLVCAACILFSTCTTMDPELLGICCFFSSTERGQRSQIQTVLLEAIRNFLVCTNPKKRSCALSNLRGTQLEQAHLDLARVYEVCMRCVFLRCVFGVYLVCIWCVFGVYLACIWCVCVYMRCVIMRCV